MKSANTQRFAILGWYLSEEKRRKEGEWEERETPRGRADRTENTFNFITEPVIWKFYGRSYQV